MMRRLLLIIFCTLSFPLMASHIVGGEFEILYINGSTYRINLLIYFDKKFGNPGAKDGSVTARIYRKRDHAFMMDVFLPLTKEEAVSYTQPECSKGEIQTDKLTYTNTVVLSATRFDDPGGYYIVWQRCCRNYSITNIISREPPAGSANFPDAAGQTFYLEFPPVVKNGQPFINSSPRLFPPLNDYACPRRPYYADFAGTDDDGDSLAYTLVTPYNTPTSVALPPNGPSPGPYPSVKWQTGFGLNNILRGAPDLKITNDGLLTVTPTLQGLFVFAVKVEEFRDGVKIGELRRDFQMLVVDVCPKAEPPQILGRKLSDASFTYDNRMDVTFDHTVSDDDRCIEVRVSDPDASKADDNFRERVWIKAIPIGFKKDVSSILPDVVHAELINGSTADFRICFDRCPLINGPFEVGIVAYDDACSLPLFDTLKIRVNVVPPPNSPPAFETNIVNITVTEGQILAPIKILGRDADLDQLVLIPNSPDAYALSQYGFELKLVRDEPGVLEYALHWNTRCREVDFSKKTQFRLEYLLDDYDECLIQKPDKMVLNLNIILPNDVPPIIDTDLTPDPNERYVAGLEKRINETLAFNVTGRDGDNDLIVLDVQGLDFDISKYTYTFPRAQAKGNVMSQFRWNILCDEVDLKKKTDYTFRFTVQDLSSYCRYYKYDTVDVTVKVLPPLNQAPEISVQSLGETPALSGSDNRVAITLGQTVALGLTGTDKDRNPKPDRLKLEMIEATGNVVPQGYVFAPAEGLGHVETTFSWHPDCSIFENGVYENEYTFAFRVYDDRCSNPKADTVAVKINIRDLTIEEQEFLPPNIITPNGDGYNDYFAMVRVDPASGELINILPKDNCVGRFEGLIIMNRWGRKVYETTDRDFRWYAPDEPTGVYYYVLRYSNKQYRGSISLLSDNSQSNR